MRMARSAGRAVFAREKIVRTPILALLIAAIPALAFSADKPAAAGLAIPAARTQPAANAPAPGQIIGISISPAQVKSAEATTAIVAGRGHCKFTVDASNGSILNQEADLPARVALSFVVASYETSTFNVKATGIDGCKGSAAGQVTVGAPVQGQTNGGNNRPLSPMTPAGPGSAAVAPKP